VATTWSLALTELEQSEPHAVGLLRLLAFCAPEPAPLHLLLQPRPGLADEVAGIVRPLLGDELAAGDAVAALRRYSLVTLAGEGLVLVQAVTADQMPAGLTRQWRQAAAALVPIQERVMGPEHPGTLDTGRDLAYWTAQAGIGPCNPSLRHNAPRARKPIPGSSGPSNLGAGAAAPGQRTQQAAGDRVLVPLRHVQYGCARQCRSGEAGRGPKTEDRADFVTHDYLREKAGYLRTVNNRGKARPAASGDRLKSRTPEVLSRVLPGP
jgi:hypothetical protein